MKTKMTNEEYEMLQHQLVTLASLVKDWDLSGFLERIGMAETIGPFVDPTLYREASGQLSDVKSLAQSLQPFTREIHRQLEKARAA